MIYYNQNNYANVKYPSSSLPNATVKSGGCGVCCASMIVENLTDKKIPPEKMSQYIIKNGCRADGGTDILKLMPILARDYGLIVSTTNDENVLKEHLLSGGMAIANVGGDRAGYKGVFSDGGHYVIACGINGDIVDVLDPAYYRGKFNKTGRKGKVAVDGDICKCNITILSDDTSGRDPNYYLFSNFIESKSKNMYSFDSVVNTMVVDNVTTTENMAHWEQVFSGNSMATPDQIKTIITRYQDKLRSVK